MMNLTIKAKLIAAFAVTTSVIIGISALSFYEMNVLKERNERIIHEDVQAIRDVDELALIQVRIQSLMHAYILSGDQATKAQIKTRMDELKATEVNLLEHAYSHASPKEEKILKAFESLQIQLTQVNKKARMALTVGSKEKAAKILIEQGGPIDDQIVKLIHDFSHAEGIELEHAIEDSQKEFDVTVMEMAGLTIAGIVFSLLVGLSVIRSLLGGMRKARNLSGRVAKGDLTETAEPRGNDELAQLLNNLNQMVYSLRKTVSSISASSQNVSTGAEQISSTSNQLQDASVSQASATEESSASMEEMTASVALTAENAQESADRAKKAAVDARKSGDAVREATTHMAAIVAKIQVMQEIARQTDLLALNAAVEAARAGDHGRGFSVVASEVRKLAERSQEAAKEIGSLTEGTAIAAENAVELMDDLVPRIESTAELVTKISGANSEMAIGMQQFNESLVRLDSNTQTHTASAEELSVTAEELAAQAKMMQETVGAFTLSNDALDEVSNLVMPIEPIGLAEPTFGALNEPETVGAEFDLGPEEEDDFTFEVRNTG